MSRFAHRQPGFNVRVAGVCIHRDHVLLSRGEQDDFWALPGGRLEFDESTAAALQREMREEIGVEVVVGSLLWLVENFFEYNGVATHELLFIYEFTLPPPLG